MTWTITPHNPDNCANRLCEWRILWWNRRQDAEGKTTGSEWHASFRSRGDAEAYMNAHDAPPPPPIRSHRKSD